MLSVQHILHALVLFTYYTPALADDSYRPCPILGPRYPLPSQLSSSMVIQDALRNLSTIFDELSISGNSSYTQTTPNTTTWSLGLFAVGNDSNSSEPFFYQYHHVAPSSTNITKVDSNTTYNIGGLSQMLTVYTFLVTVGEDLWYDQVTEYLPQLRNNSKASTIEQIAWDEVRLIDLATHLSGLSRDATLDSVGMPITEDWESLLPPNTSDLSSTPTNRDEFLATLRLRQPIYQPGTTPIYSNAAFQILALVLEEITAKPFGSIVQENVFTPLSISSTTVGAPISALNGIIPTTGDESSWGTNATESALSAATGMFSTISDLSVIGKSIFESSLLSMSTTNRWLKPHSYTSNSVNGIGTPFDIYTPSLTGDAGGPIIPIFTKLGANGLYSPYFGLVPDYGVGFVILSVDTNNAADLNAYVDYVAEYLIEALEKTAGTQAAINYSGNYTTQDDQDTQHGKIRLSLDVDGLSGLSVVNWTAKNGTIDVRAAYASMRDIPAEMLDFRLYPTNLRDELEGTNRTRLAFRAVFQNIAAPVDAGTATCITWEEGVDKLVYNGIAMDQFVFELDEDGYAVSVSIPVLGMELRRT